MRAPDERPKLGQTIRDVGVACGARVFHGDEDRAAERIELRSVQRLRLLPLEA